MANPNPREDIEERFRAACSAYLTAAEQCDRTSTEMEIVRGRLLTDQLAADQARNQLLQVVRERDLQAQLDAGEGRVRPGERASAAQAEWMTRPSINVVRPEDTDWWGRHGGMCPECGVSWREPSPDCPHQMVNWHPLTRKATDPQ